MTGRRAQLAVAWLGMLTFGIVLTTLGAVLPSLIARFGIDTTAAGALLTLMSFGILVGSLVFGPIVDHRGYKGMLLLASLLIAAGLEGLAAAPSLGWVRAAVLVIGFGGGLINGGTNALVADISAGGRSAGISLLGVFFGVGAVGVPFALGTLLGRFSYGALVAFAGATVLVPFAFAAFTEFPAPKQAQGFPLARAGRLLRDPLLLQMGAMLFLESGMEISMGGWTATYAHQVLGLTTRGAMALPALYWLGMMLTRIGLGAALRRIPAAKVMLASLVVAFGGAMLLVGSRGAGGAAAGAFLVGAGFASSYPVVLGFAGDRYAELSGTAFGLVFAMALSGGMTLPFVMGVVAGPYGLRASLLLVPAALVVLAFLLVALARRLAQESAPAAISR